MALQVHDDLLSSTSTQSVRVTHTVTDDDLSICEETMRRHTSHITSYISDGLPAEFTCNDELVNLSRCDETSKNGLPERITVALSVLPQYRAFFQAHFPHLRECMSPPMIENMVLERVLQLHSCLTVRVEW